MRLFKLAAVVGLAFTSSAAVADPVNLTLSGGNPGGLWSLLGAGIDRSVKSDDGNSVVTYQATGGGFANIGLLGGNRTDLGLLHDAEAQIALQGGEPFQGPIENMRAIGYMYNWAPMHFFLDQDMAEEYGIESIADIAESGAPIRIGINRSGNITSNVALSMLEQVGVTEESLADMGGQFVRAGANEQADLIQDGRLDMITNGIFINHSSFRSVDENNDVVLLSVPSEVIAATSEEFSTGTMTIPADSYSNQDADIDSVALGALLVATESMDDETAYSLAQSLVNNIDEVRAVHSSMAQLSPELLATPSVLEFHPGAARAYEEAGLIN
ncbi:TAXI family TRAP transporter solute-binding subunit (plasmid) [Roseivivax marinus]|jgi:TRAP transporter TAXI family solute receptor|uniref:TAXI family TRAP transporter solute-binding subunit n=1 Tax=Roseivivax marinus TaxID=1379903 RepID=UPI001F045410|nr:TAXI family TRAP transporter solute-binding subunit [Roseivivax marinus]UMA67139.1 TAXI family TRAP transporter solute-binding subunit [Roseivivax marinus]